MGRYNRWGVEQKLRGQMDRWERELMGAQWLEEVGWKRLLPSTGSQMLKQLERG
jgi:hypothetical protein